MVPNKPLNKRENEIYGLNKKNKTAIATTAANTTEKHKRLWFYHGFSIYSMKGKNGLLKYYANFLKTTEKNTKQKQKIKEEKINEK